MDLSKINQFNEQQRLAREKAQEDAKEQALTERITRSVADSTKMTTVAVQSASKKNAEAVKQELQSSTSNLIQAVQESQDSVAEALNNLVVATIVSKDPQLMESAKQVSSLLSSISQASKNFSASKLNELPVVLNNLTTTLNKMVEDESSDTETDYMGILEEIRDYLAQDDKQEPVINVSAPSVNVDTTAFEKAIKSLEKVVKASAVQIPAQDNSQVIEAIDDLKRTFANLKFPVPNFVQDPYIRYKAVDEYDDGVATNVKYYGFLSPEGNWYILKNDPSASAKTYRYAFGDIGYEQKWIDRASLTYGYPFGR